MYAQQAARVQREAARWRRQAGRRRAARRSARQACGGAADIVSLTGGSASEVAPATASQKQQIKQRTRAALRYVLLRGANQRANQQRRQRARRARGGYAAIARLLRRQRAMPKAGVAAYARITRN